MKRKAFTLIELLVVIVILAIILIIAVPKISNAIEKSKKGAIEASAKLIARDIEQKYESSFATGSVMSTSGSCMDIVNTNEYSSCTYEIDNSGKAEVTLVGASTGKFKGLTCKGTRTSAVVYEGGISLIVTFNNNGGVNNITNKNVTAGLEYGSLPLPTKSNYAFLGWYTDDAFTNKVTSKSNVTLTSDHTLYAKWGEVAALTSDWMRRITAVDSNVTKDKVRTITFHKSSENLDLIGDGVDVSTYTLGVFGSINGSTSENGKVFAYYKLNDSLYDIDIVADEVIYFPNNSFNLLGGFTNLISIDFNDSIDSSNATGLDGLFSSDKSLTSINLSDLDTSNATNMNSMFRECTSLTSLDISHFDTSKVTNMADMFSLCYKLTSLDLSSFNTKNVTLMSAMFFCCYKLTSLNLSSFDTSSVTDMSDMFYDCVLLSNLNLSNFDTSKVTNMSSMFSDCISLTELDLSHFDTSSVINMSGMFSMMSPNSTTTLDGVRYSGGTNGISHLAIIKGLSNFDTGRVTNMSYMFLNCMALTSLDVSHFDTSNVTNMSSMFENCKKINTLDLSHFDTSNVTNMSYMFNNTGYDSNNFTTTITILGNTTNYTNMFKDAAYNSNANIIVNYISDTSSLVDAMISTKNSGHVEKGSAIEELSITVNVPNIISDKSIAYQNERVTLTSTLPNIFVISFKLNGTLITGDTFTMPSTGAVITDVTTVEGLTIESAHNPYEGNKNNFVILERTFDGAKSLTIKLDVETYKALYDWIYIYDANGYKSTKYGGSMRNRLLTISGDYVKIEFTSSSNSYNYYGYKISVIPNY